MNIKNINHLIRQLFLISILFNLNNYNLFGITPGVRASQTKQKAESAVSSKDFTKFNATMTDFANITRVPGGAAAVETKRRDAVRKALISVQSPADAPFLRGILDRIFGFASEREIRDAMIRAGLLEAPAFEQPPLQQVAEILQLPEPQQIRIIRELPARQQEGVIQQLPAPQQVEIIRSLPAHQQATIIEQARRVIKANENLIEEINKDR